MLFAALAVPPPMRRYQLSARVTNTWLRRLTEVLPISAALGGLYQGHSLRFGAGSDAYAIGVPLPMIAEMMGYASVETPVRSSVRTRRRPSLVAWDVLSRKARTTILRH